MTVPKYKREIRKAIIQNVEQNKNAYSLKKLYTITDIERRFNDDELYQTVDDKEWSIWSSTNKIINCDEKTLSHVNRFIDALLHAKSERKKKSPQSSR